MTDSARNPALVTSGGVYQRGFAVQCKVIGALIMRELHTRYGRDNVGYLWMFLEPMSLAIAVSSIHAVGKTHYGSDVQPVPFTICGYVLFIMFRGMVTRAESGLEANMPLFYHRTVTVFDIFFARAILEGLSTFVTYLILIGLAVAVGLADLPYRPLDVIIAYLLFFWFSFGISILIGSWTHEYRVAGRLVHPVCYILMPLSGAFFRMQWVPDPYREWLKWWPMVQFFEELRYGQFRSADNQYVYFGYLLAWCLLLTYAGLMSGRVIRRYIHLR